MPGIDSGQAGLWVPPGAPFCGQGAVTLVANRGYIARFPCPRSMTITKIEFFVTTAASVDDPCDVGIYAASANPLSLLSSSGSKSGLLNSTGMKSATFTAGVPLVAGQIYYAAFAVGVIGGTSAVVQGVALHQNLTTMFGTLPPTCESGFNVAGFPLPASYTSPGAVSSWPILALLQ